MVKRSSKAAEPDSHSQHAFFAADEPGMRLGADRWFKPKFLSLVGLIGFISPGAHALQLTVGWDRVAGASGYKVERSANNLLFAEIASVSSTTTSYTDSNLTNGSYWYRVRAFNDTTQSDYSNVASYASTDAAPSITQQPISQTGTVGGSVTFNVTATGSPIPSYQWQKNGVALSGAISPQLSIPSLTSSDAANYTVVVTNTAGSITSNAATLTVSRSAPTATVPVISTQPATQSAAAGSSVTFTVTANGSPAPTYQWRKDGVAIGGATSSALTLNSVTTANAGTYAVVVTNSAGSATSSGAVLTVIPSTVSAPASSPSISGPSNTTTSNSTATVATPSSRLSNASIRATAGVGDQVLIVGFVIDQAAKSVLLRAVGPGLASLTTAATFTDPKLTLYDRSTAIATNDNWGGTAALKSVFKQTGAQSLDDLSKDAALVTTLGPKPYTMVVNGTGAGMALAEVYDLDSSGGRIVNIAARAPVTAGDGVLIAGFVITGTAPKQVLIRGVGPSLAPLGVSGVLSHPQIDLFRGSTRLDHNHAWGGSGAMKTAFAKTGAFTLIDSNSSDAALLVTLNPGAYSVVVSSADGTSGVALVEVYDIP